MIHKAHATDKDIGLAGIVKYFVDDPTITFGISETTGEIVLLKQVDREVKSRYTVALYAVDSAPSPFEWRTTKTLVINIGDINDNAPVFASPVSTLYADETVTVGSVAVNVVATDADEGLNSRIVYSVVSSNDSNGVFSFVPSNGSFIARSK